MKNLLFIPSYRCAPQITRVLSSLKEHQHLFQTIIVIDNISPDETAKKAKEFALKNKLDKVQVVINPENIGLGGTHKMAFDYAIANNFDNAVILHGDDQGDIKDFDGIFSLMREKKIDSFWMGARFHPKSKLVGYSYFRIFGNIVFNLISSVISTRTIFDLGGSGVNLFPVSLIKEHPYKQYSNDLTFHVYLLLNAIRMKQKINFTPVSWREDDQISNVKLLSQSVKLLKILNCFFLSSERLIDETVSFNHNSSEWKYL